ncbi:MAG: shikimate dehydrogenase [Nitrospirota bacterium]
MVQISGRTKITGIFGYPVEHTLSSVIHNAAFKSLGLDYCYVPFLVHPDYLNDAVKAIKALNLHGVNVTIPHKEKVMPLLDEIHEEASFIGAVNTIVNSDGKLIGYNTDGKGFIQSLLENHIPFENKDILIIGAGGAARAVSYYLCQKAKTLNIYNRTKERAERLVQDLKKISNNVSLTEDISSLERFHLIINATPLGLKKEDSLPFDTSLLKKEQIVCDLIYKKTRLIKEAAKKGCFILDGIDMLLWQGTLAFELWTGIRPDIKVMKNALKKIKT